MFMLKEDYIVGLVDGEGSFTVYVRDPDSVKNISRRTRAEPRFYLKLIERDKAILYRLKNFFGCGNVYFQKDSRSNHQNCYRYEVTNRNDLEKVIVPFFKVHPLQLESKKIDFEIFCRMMKMIKRGEHLKPAGLRKLYLLKQKMHKNIGARRMREIRTYGPDFYLEAELRIRKRSSVRGRQL